MNRVACVNSYIYITIVITDLTLSVLPILILFIFNITHSIDH